MLLSAALLAVVTLLLLDGRSGIMLAVALSILPAILGMDLLWDRVEIHSRNNGHVFPNTPRGLMRENDDAADFR